MLIGRVTIDCSRQNDSSDVTRAKALMAKAAQDCLDRPTDRSARIVMVDFKLPSKPR